MYNNVSLYKFKEFQDLAPIQNDLSAIASSLPIKGTILLTTEGINASFAGTEEAVFSFLAAIKQYYELDEDDLKFSLSSTIPFKKMIVKTRKQTIPGSEWTSSYAASRGKYVDAITLKKWFDNKEDLVVLDTRNDYEYQVGHFKNSVNPELPHFSHFPDWVEKNVAHFKNKKVVTFCTGGIRCEKATAYMIEAGFEDVYQLKGGILKYFEKVNELPKEERGNHYEGDCFVFDYRVAVDQDLAPTTHEVCFNCWGVLNEDAKKNPLYIPDKHCPQCYQRYQEKQNRIEAIKKEKKEKHIEAKRLRVKNYSNQSKLP